MGFYFSFFEKINFYQVLMDYCSLGSIRDLIVESDSTLEEEEIAFVVSQTLTGLTYLHAKKIIHRFFYFNCFVMIHNRDVKAANILLNAEGEVKIADFGVSDTIGKAHESIGTPLWMVFFIIIILIKIKQAPEVIKGGTYDSRCDIWSLGITIIEVNNRIYYYL